MVWPEYIHHLTLHFPIVGAVFLAAIGAWWVKTGDERLGTLVRIGGWGIFALTTAAVVSGMSAAPGFFGGEGPLDLTHHRNMGLTVWSAAAVAVVAFEYGRREDEPYVQRFGALCWIAVAFGVIGAGHWGGSAVHSDKVPWQGTEPIIEQLERENAE